MYVEKSIAKAIKSTLSTCMIMSIDGFDSCCKLVLISVTLWHYFNTYRNLIYSANLILDWI